LSKSNFSCADLGENFVDLKVTDGSGNSAKVLTRVNVVDHILPEIICLNNINRKNDPGFCGANIEIEIPVVSDNCSVSSIINNFNNTLEASGFYPVGTTEVIYTVTDFSGNFTNCSFLVEVVDNEDATLAISGDDVIICKPEYRLSANDPVVGKGKWQLVEGRATILDPEDPNTKVTNLGEGKNVLAWVISAACESNRDEIGIDYQPLEVDAGKDRVIFSGEQIILNATNGKNEKGSYYWEPSEGLSNPNIPNPVAIPLQTTSYTVTFTNEEGCSNSDEILIKIDDSNEIKPAKGLSPDGDGINDFWRIVGIGNFPENKVIIFNRWGDIVFKMIGYDNAENVFVGRANHFKKRGAGDLPEGTYFYSIELGNKSKASKGFFVLKK
ncbi:gliding motility-associated C-terminal domain-containing protein, partial [Xanthovirga aplysinae]|uniref:T9SS type B sorting domain-containing protein n=1 Tax=Xanthovirga aplysinae TaxID=2529853 RepID=UPI0012BC4229